MLGLIDFHQLSDLVKRVAKEVVKGGGVVRAVHNHGIRTLPQRFKARYSDSRGIRYYEKGRFFSIYYDANPATLRQVDQVLTIDEEVLRSTQVRTRSVLDLVKLREKHNPFVQAVMAGEQQGEVVVSNVKEAVDHYEDDEDAEIDDQTLEELMKWANLGDEDPV